MRVVVVVAPNVLELNWTWLPTFVGMNNRVKQDLERELSPKLVGRVMDEETLDYAHEEVVAFLERRFPVSGLRDYLDALKFVAGADGMAP
jgi:hypothetical protein